MRFISWSNEVAQGMRMSLDTKKGMLAVDGEEIRELVLWVETAPPRPIVVVPQSRLRPQVLAVWNVCKRTSGCDAWIGNCGMLVEEAGPNLTLRCSDGVGPPNFEDLVVEIGRVGAQP